jgi:hypothetical protein
MKNDEFTFCNRVEFVFGILNEEAEWREEKKDLE